MRLAIREAKDPDLPPEGWKTRLRRVFSAPSRDGHGIRDAISSRRVYPAEKKTSGKLQISLPPRRYAINMHGRAF